MVVLDDGVEGQRSRGGDLGRLAKRLLVEKSVTEEFRWLKPTFSHARHRLHDVNWHDSVVDKRRVLTCEQVIRRVPRLLTEDLAGLRACRHAINGHPTPEEQAPFLDGDE